jgi:predicted metal-dependent hydrolase
VTEISSDEFARGVEHFNAAEFWEAHESWEQLWLEAEGDLVEFYQGLIQLAAAYHHCKRGTLRGAVRLFDAAARRLAPFPPRFHDLDREDAAASAARHRDWAAANIESGAKLDSRELPKLVLSRPGGA